MSSRVNKTVRIWKSHRTNFFSQYDEHDQKLSLDRARFEGEIKIFTVPSAVCHSCISEKF